MLFFQMMTNVPISWITVTQMQLAQISPGPFPVLVTLATLEMGCFVQVSISLYISLLSTLNFSLHLGILVDNILCLPSYAV